MWFHIEVRKLVKQNLHLNLWPLSHLGGMGWGTLPLQKVSGTPTYGCGKVKQMKFY